MFDRIDGAADFMVATGPIPWPGPGKVRYRVAAFAPNQADLLLTQGRHYARADLPIRLGYERSCAFVLDAIRRGALPVPLIDSGFQYPRDAPITAGRGRCDRRA